MTCVTPASSRGSPTPTAPGAAGQGAIFAAVLTTARKLRQNAYEQLCSIAGPSPLHAAGIPS